jgi:hypothetical protein
MKSNKQASGRKNKQVGRNLKKQTTIIKNCTINIVLHTDNTTPK